MASRQEQLVNRVLHQWEIEAGALNDINDLIYKELWYSVGGEV